MVFLDRRRAPAAEKSASRRWCFYPALPRSSSNGLSSFLCHAEVVFWGSRWCFWIREPRTRWWLECFLPFSSDVDCFTELVVLKFAIQHGCPLCCISNVYHASPQSSITVIPLDKAWMLALHMSNHVFSLLIILLMFLCDDNIHNFFLLHRTTVFSLHYRHLFHSENKISLILGSF